MLAAEIQERMRLIVEAQRSLEVQLQDVHGKLQEAQAKEKNCDDGLTQVSKALFDVTSTEVVSMPDFKRATDMVAKISDFRDQARSLVGVLQANARFMSLSQQRLQSEYDALALKLKAAENNILQFP
jgi:hypothetical protein